MLTVHHLNNSRSFRIVWLCEELSLAYKLINYTRNTETQRAPDSLNKIHQLGKAPVIEHDGQVIAETDAIIEYICQKLAAGKLSHGPASPDYGPYLQWLAFPEGTLMPGLGFDLIYAWTGGGNEVMKDFFEAEIVKNHRYVEDTLARHDHILKAGFSAADINLTWTLEFSEARGRLRSLPKAQAYVARMRQRPAYQQTIKRGGQQDLSVFSAGV
jgi:glutathione S-transferase